MAGDRRKKNAEAEIDARYFLGVILNRWKPILGMVLLSALMGFLYLSFQKNLYTATALIQLRAQEPPILNSETMTLARFEDSAAVQSELDILKSPALIRRVVEKLKLDRKAEFNGSLAPKTFVRQLKDYIKNQDKKSGAETPEQKEIVMIGVTNAVQSRLRLNKNPLSYTVGVSFTSRYANRARVIANAIADEYLVYQIESGSEESGHARKWYTRRLEELRRNVIDSERAVQEFSEKHNLFELDGKTLDDQQVSEMNEQLAQARAEEAQAEARLTRARALLRSGAGADSVKEVLNSSLVQNLREKEAELLRQKSDMAGRFGPQHPESQRITREIDDLREKIAVETRKIVEAMNSEVEIMRARVVALRRDVDAMRPLLNDEKRVQMTELKRQSEANRILYESFLSKARETREAENIDRATAKIISHASLPLSPSYPKKALILGFFLMTGAFCGVALAFLLELLNVGFADPAQIEERLGIASIGMSPETQDGGRGLNPMHVESLRSILAGLRYSPHEVSPKTIMIVSALPQEGKGWLAVSLGRVAARAGRKVLLLDCDFHRPMAPDTFDGVPVRTINDYLAGGCAMRETLNVESDTGLHYVVSSPHAGGAQALIESERMRELIAMARAAYDLVIIDSPPVVGMSDVFFLSRHADAAIFAVRWARTPRRIAQNALRILSRARVNVVGAVLTRVDMRHYKKHEFGGRNFYNQYGAYFGEESSASENLAEKILRFGAGR